MAFMCRQRKDVQKLKLPGLVLTKFEMMFGEEKLGDGARLSFGLQTGERTGLGDVARRKIVGDGARFISDSVHGDVARRTGDGARPNDDDESVHGDVARRTGDVADRLNVGLAAGERASASR